MNTYWKKQSGGKLLQCLGTTKSGRRCTKKFYHVQKYMDNVFCTMHKNQKITYNQTPDQNNKRDVFYLIASFIEDPTTFHSWSNVCLSTAKACHYLQEDKMIQFRRLCDCYFCRTKADQYKHYILPNNQITDRDGNNLTLCC